jgi:hypothetical protein
MKFATMLLFACMACANERIPSEKAHEECSGMELNDACDALQAQINTLKSALAANEVEAGILAAACAAVANPIAKGIACAGAAGMALTITLMKAELMYDRTQANRLGCPWSD